MVNLCLYVCVCVCVGATWRGVGAAPVLLLLASELATAVWVRGTLYSVQRTACTVYSVGGTALLLSVSLAALNLIFLFAALRLFFGAL